MKDLNELIGKKIQRIFYNESHLKFVTDKGDLTFTVDGDCCSRSMFYDFIGVKKLLENKEVVAINDIDLYPDDIIKHRWEMKDRKSSDEDIKVYGYSITTIDPVWGEVTSVFSFRNYSNGYYGGWMSLCSNNIIVSPEIFDDVMETTF